jgi:NAD dependent epimerase/dehydratase family enzyme
MSWIALDDVIGAFRHVLATETLRGPINAVAPTPVTNAEFTRTLARVLHRPTLLPMPASALRLVLGEMAELLLSSQRVTPSRLQASGYTFRHPTLEGALRSALGSS